MTEIVKACQSGEIPNMDIACVVSSNPEAGGIEKAKTLGIPSDDIIIVDPRDFKKDGGVDEVLFGHELLYQLSHRGVTVVTQNGWLPKTPEAVIFGYQGKIFNQHPGPVPEFGGKDMWGKRVHAALLGYRRWTSGDWRREESWTEVIAQRVDKDYDQGAVVKKVKVVILPSDTPEDLQKRALPVEHRVQIELLKDVAAGAVHEVGLRPPIVTTPAEKLVCELSRKMAILLYPKG